MPSALEVVDRGAEADRFDDRPACRPRTSTARRWCVKPSRRTSRIISPPPRNGGIASSSSARAQSAPMPLGPQHLVGGERDEVGVPRLHVGGDVRHVLARVDEHERVVRVRGVGERPDLVDRAEHVRHRADREQLGAVEQLVEVGEVEPVVVGRSGSSAARCRAPPRACATARRWRGAPCAMSTIASPSRRLARAHVYATRLIASVALRVKTISLGRRGVDERRRPCARAASKAAVASSAIVYTPRWMLA